MVSGPDASRSRAPRLAWSAEGTVALRGQIAGQPASANGTIKHSGFELRGSTVLAYDLLFTDPHDLDSFLDRAVGFREHIPQVVRSRYSGDT